MPETINNTMMDQVKEPCAARAPTKQKGDSISKVPAAPTMKQVPVLPPTHEPAPQPKPLLDQAAPQAPTQPSLKRNTPQAQSGPTVPDTNRSDSAAPAADSGIHARPIYTAARTRPPLPPSLKKPPTPAMTKTTANKTTGKAPEQPSSAAWDKAPGAAASEPLTKRNRRAKKPDAPRAPGASSSPRYQYTIDFFSCATITAIGSAVSYLAGKHASSAPQLAAALRLASKDILEACPAGMQLLQHAERPAAFLEDLLTEHLLAPGLPLHIDLPLVRLVDERSVWSACLEPLLTHPKAGAALQAFSESLADKLRTAEAYFLAMQVPQAFALYAGHLGSHAPGQLSRCADGELLRKMLGTKALAAQVAEIMQGYVEVPGPGEAPQLLPLQPQIYQQLAQLLTTPADSLDEDQVLQQLQRLCVEPLRPVLAAVKQGQGLPMAAELEQLPRATRKLLPPAMEAVACYIAKELLATFSEPGAAGLGEPWMLQPLHAMLAARLESGQWQCTRAAVLLQEHLEALLGAVKGLLEAR